MVLLVTRGFRREGGRVTESVPMVRGSRLSRPADHSTAGHITVSAKDRRFDIQALRALAVLAVFAYHVVPERLPGGFVGVDVFFVVSGYLVGGALVAEVLATGRVAFGRFYARRLRRIAPLATTVAVVTLVGAALTVSPLRLVLWGLPAGVSTYTRDGLASQLGVANLWFGVSDVGYAANSYLSPFTHYWSLGVEEQFYLFAPLAIALAFRLGRKVGVLALGAVCVFAFDIAMAQIELAGVESFYSPVSRAWELGIGTLVAVAVPWLRLLAWRGAVVTAIVWAAWFVLLACAVRIVTPQGWPTPEAIVPVAATAVILGAGAVRSAGRFASSNVVQWIGDRSFGIYLWHWPIIVIAVPLSSFPRTVTMAAAVLASLVLSAASYRWIECPFRRQHVASKRGERRVLFTGLVVVASGAAVIAGVGVWASTRPMATSLLASPYEPVPVGVAQQEFATIVPHNLRPALTSAGGDFTSAYRDDCNVTTRSDHFEFAECVYGTTGPLVALFGDSHASQWFDALQPAVDRGDIRVALVTADGCPPFEPTSLGYREVCTEWQKLAVSRINSLDTALVIASARVSSPTLDGDGALEGASLAIGHLRTDLQDVRVLWIADTPTLTFDPSSCAAKDVFDISACATATSEALQPLHRDPIKQAVIANGWHWLDLNDYMCDTTQCGVILGDVFMYRDDDHLTSTFAAELSPALMEAVMPLVDH